MRFLKSGNRTSAAFPADRSTIGHMSPFRVWFLAIRPKTLTAAVAPIVMGTSMAYADGFFHGPSATVALLGGLLIQIGTNFANDYFDFVKGADTQDRVGPMRVTQARLMKPETMRWAYRTSFGVAIVLGGYLVYRGGWPIVVIGLSSVLFGVLYTGGTKPLGYLGLGDFLVLVYFGPVALGTTYYVQAQEFEPVTILAGLAPGFLSVSLLAINNLRDIATDAKVGKKTLAVRFGENFARIEYVLCIVLASFIPVYLTISHPSHLGALLATAACVIALAPMRIVLKENDSHRLIHALDVTSRLLVVYALAFSIGWVL